MPSQTQLKYWVIAAALFLLALWYLGNVLMPFVIGGAVAYFLDPLADRLERLGLGRTAATVMISATAALIFVIAGLLIIPAIIQQASAVVRLAPEVATSLQAWLTRQLPSLMDEQSALRQSLATVGAAMQARGGNFVDGLVASAMSVVNMLMLFVVVPVVAFYLLLDWDRMIAAIDDLLPRQHAPVIRRLAREIDHTLASFVRGMGTVSLILGTYYAVALMVVGLQFGLFVGAVAGLVTFIPYVGALLGGALALGLGLFQFWGDWWTLGLIAAIFMSGQFIEGNFLTPRLVGESVGLHPVWLLFALSAFGSLFGFVGMLVAVPVAASLGVIARYLVSRYREGQLYRGAEPAEGLAERHEQTGAGTEAP